MEAGEKGREEEMGEKERERQGELVQPIHFFFYQQQKCIFNFIVHFN